MFNQSGSLLRCIGNSLGAIAAISVCGLLGISLAGCGGGGGTYSPTFKGNNVVAADFGLVVAPATQTVVQGTTAHYTINITPVGGFNSPITLAATGLPSGAIATFGAITATGSGSTATLDISTTAPGNVQSDAALGNKSAHTAVSTSTKTRLGTAGTPIGTTTFTISATGGGISHSTTGSIVVSAAISDFTIALTPASVTVGPGGIANYTVTMNSVGSFNVNNLEFSVTSKLPQGATVAFNRIDSSTSQRRYNLAIQTTGQGETITPLGTTTITVGASANGVSHSASANLVVANVGDFAISFAPQTATIQAGASASYTLTLTSTGGFNQPVTLSISSILPLGVSAAFGSTVVTPTPTGATTTLTLATNVAAATPPGTYLISVTGNGGNVHTYQVTLNVNGNQGE